MAPSLASTPVSLLDLAPVTQGSTPVDALRDMIALARVADDLGCRRFWVAEHHNIPGIASCAPPVLATAIAAVTRRIRVGSGGVMLPNHAPLTVAEQFRTLDALHPGRIDLGVGRAPGTDRTTAQALRRHRDDGSEPSFPDDLNALLGHLGHRSAAPGEFSEALRGSGAGPDVWLLGASEGSAALAGTLGLSYAYAHHLNARDAAAALAAYRRVFDAAGHPHASRALVSVRVICGEDEDDARRLAAPAAVASLRAGRGRPHDPYPPCDVAVRELTPADQERFAGSRATQAIGAPDTVRRRLVRLLRDIRPDELMITAVIPELADRVRSLERTVDLVDGIR